MKTLKKQEYIEKAKQLQELIEEAKKIEKEIKSLKDEFHVLAGDENGISIGKQFLIIIKEISRMSFNKERAIADKIDIDKYYDSKKYKTLSVQKI